MENERKEHANRGWQTNELIKRHKKLKLQVKDQLEKLARFMKR